MSPKQLKTNTLNKKTKKHQKQRNDDNNYDSIVTALVIVKRQHDMTKAKENKNTE